MSALVGSIKSYFHQVDDPPPDEIIVYNDTIKEIESKRFEVCLKVVTTWSGGEKQHKPKIHVNVDDTFHIIPDTIEYT